MQFDITGIGYTIIRFVVRSCCNRNRRCYDMPGLLSSLIAVENEPVDVLILSRADEGGADFNSKDKRTQVHKVVQAEIFPTGRDFK